MSPTPWRRQVRAHPRLVGLVLCAFGIGLIKLLVAEPLAAAQGGAPVVTLHEEGLFLIPALLLLGLSLLIGGEATWLRRAIGDGVAPWRIYTAAGVVVAAGLTLDLWMRHEVAVLLAR